MGHKYEVEYTDTFAGEANYCWVRRDIIHMPDLTHYGYDGWNNYSKANRVFQRELMRKAKAAVGLTGTRGRVDRYGDSIKFRPYRMHTVMFVNYRGE